MVVVAGGPMFAGKTTWLLNYIQDLPQGTFQLFKPNIDIRYATDACVSHDGKGYQALNLEVEKPEFPELPAGISIILIDELNFFQPDKLLPALTKQIKLGRSVIAAGLAYDFLRKPFGATLPLAKTADKFIQLYATCDGCGKKAKHSYRKVASREQVVVGASESYGPCCLTCWKKLSNYN